MSNVAQDGGRILPFIGAAAGAVVIFVAQDWLQPKFLREHLQVVALRVQVAVNLPRGTPRPVATVHGRACLDELLQHFRCRYGRQKRSVQSRMEQEVRAKEDLRRQKIAEQAEAVHRDHSDETDAPQSYPRAARIPRTTRAARVRLRGLPRCLRAGIVSRRGGDLLTRGHVDTGRGGGAVVRDEGGHAHNCRGRADEGNF
eukprot:scaffold5225_cov64-Phaeocystis_antarctica.AAC.3